LHAEEESGLRATSSTSSSVQHAEKKAQEKQTPHSRKVDITEAISSGDNDAKQVSRKRSAAELALEKELANQVRLIVD